MSFIQTSLPIILASASPRRSELLKQTGLTFTVDVSDADENCDATDPEQYVIELSRRKASAVAPKHPNHLIIGADTVVVYDDEILGKPKDEKEALDMLMYLSGRTHQVVTGVTLLRTSDSGILLSKTFAEVTNVTMYKNDRYFLQRYIDTKEPMDKAGAYGIQGMGALLVEKIEGDYNTVVGLPLARVCRELADLDPKL
ncbi:septum formation protein [Lachnospiraceae bacterium C10]|jgi:septum formation protein|nr:septum formation protein [Lachnospiraceae bacterium C10]SDW56648.1 septum formation protein [Lachnospiraceae bacterium KHCPX20]